MTNSVVANLCIEIIEESAITASTTPSKIGKRYVDDSFFIFKKHSVSTFHDTLYSIDPKISFISETWRPRSPKTMLLLQMLQDSHPQILGHHEKRQKIITVSTLLNHALNRRIDSRQKWLPSVDYINHP